MTPDDDTAIFLDSQYRQFREPLLELADRCLNPALRRRCSPEDILQETFATAVSHLSYLRGHPEVPPYFKWRRLLLNTLSDMERMHLHCLKRGVQCEVSLSKLFEGSVPNTAMLDRLRASVSTPRTKVDRLERADLILKCVAELPPDERRMITLRQFDRCTMPRSARLMNLTDKEAFACYMRAIRHLRRALSAFSELQP